MKKTLLAVFSLVLLLTSCGGGSDNKGSENVDSKAEASQIIEYTNNLIDYLNGTGDWMRSNEGRIEDMLTYMQDGKRATVFLPIISNISLNMNAGKKNLTSPPSVMTEEERTYFKNTMTAYKTAYESMTDKCATLYKYIQNQDYKDDNFEKGKLLADSVEYHYNYLVDTKSELYKKIDTATEKAEEIILADYPLREPILTLKADMKAFEDLQNTYAEYNEGKLTAEQVDAAYQKLASDVEKNKGMYSALLEEHKEKSGYDSFYKRADDALATFRKVLREVKAGKKVTDREFNSFVSDRNSLVSAYNNFAN